MLLVKTNFIFILSAISAMSASAQEAVVSGHIIGLKEPTIIFSYASGESSKMDTVYVKNEKFTWQASLPGPQRVNVFFPKRMIDFYAEQGHIQMSGEVDSLHKLKITGSRSQEESDAYERSLKDLTDQEMPLYHKYGKGSKEEQIALEARLDDLRNQKRERAAKYIAAHPKSAVSLGLVEDRATMGDYHDVKKLFDLLHASAQQTVTGKQIAARLTILQRSALGEPMLDFTQNNMEGQPVRFAEFKGKYVFVDFWASWCGPCRAENPNVLKAYNQYKDKNFTVVGVSLDDNGDRWKKAVKDDNMPWTQLSDLKGWNNEVSTYYGIRGIPSSLLIDPQGKIIAKNLRGEALHQKLATLLD